MPAVRGLEQGVVRIGSLNVHHTHGGRGSPVLLIHGLGSAGYLEWRFNLEAIAARHTVYAPDLPGFGRSDKPASARYGVPLFTRTLVRYLRELNLRQVAVVGTSLGGRVALELALRHRNLLTKLVLVNSLGLGRPQVQPLYPLAALPGVGEVGLRAVSHGLRHAPAAWVRRAVTRLAGASGDLDRLIDDAYIEELRRQYGAEPWRAAYLATVRSIMRLAGSHDLTRRLATLDLPVLLIWGGSDPLFPVEHATRAQRLLPNSRLVVIEGAGHTVMAERPEQFNKALLEFLGR